VKVEYYEGKAISVELPATVDLTVVDTEPGMKGASVSNVTKAAKLETGLMVQVPPFIEIGEKVRVGTAEGDYQSAPKRRTTASQAGRIPPREDGTQVEQQAVLLDAGNDGRSGGAQARSKAATSSAEMAISQVGMDWPGVAPPPTRDSPSTS